MGRKWRLRAVFDGEVLRPERQLNLQPNTTYVVILEEASDERLDEQLTYPLTEIGRLATDMGVTDLSTAHDRYAHGPIPDGDHGP